MGFRLRVLSIIFWVLYIQLLSNTHRDNRPFLLIRWNATLLQCQRTLTPADWRRVAVIATPGKLVKYLQVLIQSRSSDIILQSKIGDIIQSVEVFKQLADEIQASMNPQGLDISIVWGLTGLLIEVS